MPKFYCEYCDLYLTHSGLSGRRQHLTGRRHINNKIEYYQMLIRDNVTHHALNTIPRVVIQLDKLHVGGYVTSADLVATLRIHLDFVSMETLEERPWLYAKPIPYPDFELPPGVTLNGELWKPNNPTYDKLFYGTFEDTFNGDVDEENKWILPPPHPEEDRYQEYYDYKIFHTFPHHKPVLTATSEVAKQAWLNAEAQLAGLRKYLAKRIAELTA